MIAPLRAVIGIYGELGGPVIRLECGHSTGSMRIYYRYERRGHRIAGMRVRCKECAR